MAANNKKSPAGAILALLILVIIVVALIFILRGGGDESDTQTTPPATGEVVNTPGGDEGQDGQAPPTDSVEETNIPTTSPTETAQPTLEPTPSPTPSPTPTPAPAATSGSFKSDTGTGLNIVADWTLTPNGDGTSTLTLKLSAESYSLYTVDSWHAAKLELGGSSWEFDTKAIEYEGPGLGTNELGTLTATISSSAVPATATLTWNFQGSYGGTELPKIVATGTIG